MPVRMPEMKIVAIKLNGPSKPLKTAAINDQQGPLIIPNVITRAVVLMLPNRYSTASFGAYPVSSKWF